MNVMQDFAIGTGSLAPAINGGDVEKPGLSDRANHVVPVAAVPLRSVPSADVKWDSKKSSNREDENGGFDGHSVMHPCNIKRRKVDVVQDFANGTGSLSPAVNGGDVEKPGHSDRANYVVPIAAVPLRSVPAADVKWDSKKSSHREDENSLGSDEDSWKRDYEKLASVIVQAKDFINSFDIKYSMSEQTRQKLDENSSEEGIVKKEKGSVPESKFEEDEEEISILSPARWDMLHSCSEHESKGYKIGEKESQVEVIEIVDLDHGECASVGTKEKLTVDDYNAMVNNSAAAIEKVVKNSEPRNPPNHEELINLMNVQHDQPQGIKAREALKMFEEHYAEVLEKNKLAQLRGEGKVAKYAHLEAADRLKSQGMWIYLEKPFGHIPGIEIGDEFRFRAELSVVGLHRQLVSGIDYVVLDGKKFATSVVNSGRYENNTQEHDTLIYSGQGGNPKFTDKAGDQKLEKGNLALFNSMEMGYPVRVLHKIKSLMSSNTLGMCNKGNSVYVYDGLYTINSWWEERDQNGMSVFKFELRRMSGQPRPHQIFAKSRNPKTCVEVCVLDDISEGKEKFPIRAMNGVDNDKPPSFTYTTNIFYANWYQPIESVGCSCVNGCSDSLQCPCVLKNGGEIPFNENGAIVRAKRRVHECGPSCKCPPTCMNRVSQHGPRYQLEIFKTKHRGWGVRSRDHISSGSFICEYVGELLEEEEAEKRVGDDEYLFDICEDGFAIDAAAYGNIGRFINHSCSPNLYAQDLFYDHDDKRMPHVMFFATRNIPPLEELTYDYNYKMDRVCDANGNIKTKKCYCGSRKCTGRMY